MAGGLIQIVAYGTQDLFLTGVPQITFFKTVYKKYTNFAIESISVPLEGNPNFDNRSVTLLPKTGDLIYKFYLQVTIPEINLIIPPSSDTTRITKLQLQLTQYKNLLETYNTFFTYNFAIINRLKIAINSIDASWDILLNLKNKLKDEYLYQINQINLNLDNVIKLYEKQFPISDSSKYKGSTDNIELFVNTVNTFLIDTVNYYKKKERLVYANIDKITKGLNNLTSTNDYFSWIQNLGFNLINKCSIMIGGNDIVQFDTDFLNIYYSLNGNFKQKTLLDEMIGNISNLTDYNNNIKPQTTLYIPLPYWFSLHNGNNLPLVSMVYHDVEYSIDFNSIDKCCFYNGSNNINNLSLSNCNILIDYIYLDIDERKKFANFSHEYLIQSVQTISSYNTNTLEGAVNLDFMHPVKELYWILKETDIVNKYKLNNLYYPITIFEINDISLDMSDNTLIKISFNINLNNLDTNILFFQPNSYINLKYTKYYDGKYKVISSTYDSVTIKLSYIDNQYINYTDSFYGIIYNDTNTNYFNPINTQYLLFNGINRTENVDSNYFNYVVPYQYYNTTPMDGANIYSFSLHPAEFQPSGSSNFSLIKSKSLVYNLNDNYYNYLLINNLEYTINVYCINYNILRIHNGLTNLIFS